MTTPIIIEPKASAVHAIMLHGSSDAEVRLSCWMTREQAEELLKLTGDSKMDSRSNYVSILITKEGT